VHHSKRYDSINLKFKEDEKERRKNQFRSKNRVQKKLIVA
jgi:hypothetical protein